MAQIGTNSCYVENICLQYLFGSVIERLEYIGLFNADLSAC